MNKAFERILERLDAKKQYFQKFYEEDGKTEEDECINKETQLAFDDAKNIVQEVAEEYKKETYFNLDNVTLHKCPKCGGNAQHRVNQRGSWACGCFECGLFKSDYDHQKAIQEWEDYCKEYNGGWIPCSERMPVENQKVMLQDIYGNITIETMKINNGINGFSDGNWWSSANNYIAWQPSPEPYKERD